MLSVYVFYNAGTMVDLDLNVANVLWGVWLKGVDASDYLQTTHYRLQRQPRIETLLAAFAALYLHSSYTETSFLSDALRYIENDFFTCGRFPYQHTIINRWFTLTSDSELREQASSKGGPDGSQCWLLIGSQWLLTESATADRGLLRGSRAHRKSRGFRKPLTTSGKKGIAGSGKSCDLGNR